MGNNIEILKKRLDDAKPLIAVTGFILIFWYAVGFVHAGSIGEQVQQGGEISGGFYKAMTTSLGNILEYFKVGYDLVTRAPISILVLVVLIILLKFFLFDRFFEFMPGVVNNILAVLLGVMVFPLVAQFLVSPLLQMIGV